MGISREKFKDLIFFYGIWGYKDWFLIYFWRRINGKGKKVVLRMVCNFRVWGKDGVIRVRFGRELVMNYF